MSLVRFRLWALFNAQIMYLCIFYNQIAQLAPWLQATKQSCTTCSLDSAELRSQNACDYVAAPIFTKSAPKVEQRTENLVSQAAILNRCCAESACILQVLLAESACLEQATWLQSNQGTLVRFRLWALFNAQIMYLCIFLYRCGMLFFVHIFAFI